MQRYRRNIVTQGQARAIYWRRRLCCLVLLSLSLAVRGESAPLEDLERVQTQIRELQRALDEDGSMLASARTQASVLVEEIDQASKRQALLEAQLERKQLRIAELREQRADTAASLERQQALLARSALTRYALSRQPKLKLLLNQRDATVLSRNLAYYDYALRAYNGNYAETNKQFRTLHETEAALRLESNTLQRLRLETETHLQLLDSVHDEREKLLSAISVRLEQRATRLQVLVEDERRLLELIEQLGTLDQPSRPPVDFAELKGSLAWPTTGTMAQAPDGVLREGGVKWSGVLIETEAGAAVRAIASGTIVYADWFRNLGQLVIIDHGNGYMSLYGNNESLHHPAGEQVRTGDQIATVGRGEGVHAQGSYFELRADGAPLDPRQWCAQP